MRLAGYGFVVAVPEIYHRVEPPGTVLGFDDEGKARGQADAEAITTRRVRRGHRGGASTWLERACPSVGAAGHCTGGHLAFRAAFDARVRGTACWYPTGPARRQARQGPTPDSLARAGEIDGELLLIFGTRDPHTPPDGAARPCTTRRCAGTRVHAGTSTTPSTRSGATSAPRFDPEATDAAFAETVAFFRRALR